MSGERALFGLTPEEAFYVKCDAELNPPEVRDLGQVITEIGVAIVRPAEFVIFRISQSPGRRKPDLWIKSKSQGRLWKTASALIPAGAIVFRLLTPPGVYYEYFFEKKVQPAFRTGVPVFVGFASRRVQNYETAP